MRPPRLLPAALLVGATALLALGACIDDPAAPRSTARLALHTTVHGRFQVADATSYLDVEIGYYGQSENFVVLRSARLPLDTDGAQPLDVDIAQCLQDQGPIVSQIAAMRAPARLDAPAAQRSGSDASCNVQVRITLYDGGQVVDAQTFGPYELRLGEQTETDPAQLFVGTAAPTVSVTASRAVYVDDSLLRVPLRAVDSDGNLQGLNLFAYDSIFGGYVYGSLYLDSPADSISGPVYAFLPVPPQYVSLKAVVEAFDSKGSYSGPDTAAAGFPLSNAPRVTNVTATSAGGQATVSFLVRDTTTAATRVEVLFRSPDQSQYDLSLLLPVCSRTVTASVGAKTVTCPAPDVGGARVIVVPFDAADNPGGAGRGTLP